MMSEPTPTQTAVPPERTSVVTLTTTEPTEQDIPVLRLRLKKPKTDKQVQWTSGTVDNEFLNKKKSKCCCIFEKKRLPTDESSDEDSDQDECEHCHGHIEQRVKSRPATTVNVDKSEAGPTIHVLGFDNPDDVNGSPDGDVNMPDAAE